MVEWLRENPLVSSSFPFSRLVNVTSGKLLKMDSHTQSTDNDILFNGGFDTQSLNPRRIDPQDQTPRVP